MTFISIEDRMQKLNSLYGTPKTNNDLLKRYVQLGRRTGKTYTLLKTLRDGDVILTNSLSLWNDLLEKHLISNVKVVKIDPTHCNTLVDIMAKNADKIRGYDRNKIKIDNSLVDEVMLNNISSLDTYI